MKSRSVDEMSREEIRARALQILEEDREYIRVRFTRRRDFEDAEKRGTDTSKIPKLNEMLVKRENVETQSRAYNEMYLIRAAHEEEKREREEQEELVRAILNGEFEEEE
jgi:hypothetical protein